MEKTLRDLQAEFLLDFNVPGPQCHFQFSSLLQGGHLQFQQDVMSWPKGTTNKAAFSYLISFS